MWLGLIGAVLIGLTLGLLGSGGSAITVPVLNYVVGHETKQAIAESMAIVGLICVVAAIPYARKKQVDWYSVLYFGLPGMLGTFVGAYLGGISPAVLQMVVFGCVLLIAAYMMLRKPKPGLVAAVLENSGGDQSDEDAYLKQRAPLWKIAFDGLIVGIVTGFVGVGGGFLIVPALVLFGKLPMRLAIGTSLVIIALKSLVGFAKYQHYLLTENTSVDVRTIAMFVVVGVLGSLAGGFINHRLNQRVLKRTFALFLLVLGGFVIIYESSNFFPAPNTEPDEIETFNKIEPGTGSQICFWETDKCY
jgi:uncharacterized protein